MYLNGYVDGYAGGWFGPVGGSVPPPDLDMDTPFERWRFVENIITDFTIPAIQTEFIVDFLQTEFFCNEDEKMIKLPYKDPDEKQDYKLHWTNRLTPLADTIASSTWSIVEATQTDEDPLVIVTQDLYDSNLSTRVWLQGGKLGAKYQLLNHIVTNGGRILEQTCELKIKVR